MKFVKQAFYTTSRPDGAGAPSGGGADYLKRHKFNFVRYASDGVATERYDTYIEPVNVSDQLNIEDNVCVGEGVEAVVYEGIEVLSQVEATGFDDPRGL